MISNNSGENNTGKENTEKENTVNNTGKEQPEQGRGKGRGGKRNKPKKVLPTHFFAVRINNPDIIDGIVNWQNSVLQKHKELLGEKKSFKLEDYLIKKEKLHFTLFVLTLATPNDIKECASLFQSCKDEILKIVDTNLGGSEFSFKLSGVHTFEDVVKKKGRVVFSTHSSTFKRLFCQD